MNSEELLSLIRNQQAVEESKTKNSDSFDSEDRKKANENIEAMRSTKGQKRGRRPAKVDNKMRLERSQQSARECRARKKLRYQYLEELVTSREKAILVLREELEMYKKICHDVDEGNTPKQLKQILEQQEQRHFNPLRK